MGRVQDLLGCSHSIFGFGFGSSIDVAIAVSRSGGVGIWGCTRQTPDEIEAGVSRMKAELGDLPWGVDLVIPAGMPERDDRSAIESTLPPEHVEFVSSMRQRYGVPDDGLPGMRSRFVRSEETARDQLAVAMDHRIPVLAVGVGSPTWAVEQAHDQGSLIVSLVGRPAHAETAIRAGADILVAQGTDSGGHTGPIGTFTLVPLVVEAAGGRPVLAAGGVATGRHIAAAMALGADGVWVGTAFLASVEAAPSPVLLEKLLAADATDTVISRSVSGKTLRMLRSAWSDEWSATGAPEPLKMPHQDILIGDLLGQVMRHEVAPLVHEGAGQGVVHLAVQQTVAEIMDGLVSEAEGVLAGLGTDSSQGGQT
ncbi:MAG: nitronate monooxygenase [Actinomycetota bacterium]|nr:nitronate monooxygenase [Actinomycetota bacterium]